MLQIEHVRQLPLRNIAPQRHSTRHQTHQPRARSYRRERPRLGAIAIGLFLCLNGLAVYIWPRVSIVRLGYQMQSREQLLQNFSQERDQLRLEVASLKDPQRVYRVATEQLGMHVPRHEQVFIVTREGKVQ